ncbi:hypothetical protein SAMN06264364_12144 [Quadrisphaera granulorum]|uniref:Uncharacterized protein n=1 Tax=Quadrisphaera granulorum TaxID=317664 RepID=A0A316AMD5_9ACTN|nr:hypothetical protein BXY45_12144 [Quadrisphaera granulorum]SZE97817.1 hypothetical protein SAMN06264364_12144 [Quadrisphaera granulorum]
MSVAGHPSPVLAVRATSPRRRRRMLRPGVVLSERSTIAFSEVS